MNEAVKVRVAVDVGDPGRVELHDQVQASGVSAREHHHIPNGRLTGLLFLLFLF